MGEGSPHIIAFISPSADKFLKLRNDFFPASVSCIVHTIAVMDLFSAIQAQDDIAHFPITEIDHIIIDQKAISGQRETEILVMFLLNAAGI